MHRVSQVADKARMLAVKRSLWVALITAGSVGFSFALACATPFAALATLAALICRDGICLPWSA